MKLLYVTFFISMTAFGGVYDCDLNDGDSAWQVVTVTTDDEENVNAVSLSSGDVGAKATKLVCEEVESEIYSCSKNHEEIALVQFEENNLTLTTSGSEDVGLYVCH